MKKSKLRSIIKESIKELIGEQVIPDGYYTLSNIQDALDYIEVNGSIIAGYSSATGTYSPGFRYSVCKQQACANGYWTGSDCNNPGTGCITVQHSITDIDTLTIPGGGLDNSILDASNDPNSGYYDLVIGQGPGTYYAPCNAACEAYTPPLLGCTDPAAANFNPEADTDDGSCVILGCTDDGATNFNPNATQEDGSCSYGDPDPNPGDFSGGPGGGPSGGPVDVADLGGTMATPQLSVDPSTMGSTPYKTPQRKPSKGDMQRDRMKKLANIKPRRKK